MPPQQYLSTDPNAGAAPPETGGTRYLSTDPNAGSPTPAEDASASQPQERSVTGFLGNVARSGAEFVGNAAKGALMVSGATDAMLRGPASPAFDETARLAQSMQGAGPRLLQGAQEYFGNRYGSMEALGDTAYTDPVGLAADASTLFTAGGAAMGSAPGRLGQAGRALTAVGTVVDPAAVAARTAGAMTRGVGRGVDMAGEAMQPMTVLGEQGDLFGASRVVTQPKVPTPMGRVLRTGAAGVVGNVMGDPTGGVATAMAMQAFESPALRAAMASRVQGAGQAMTRSTQAATVSPDTLTRLAVLAALRGDQ